LQHFHPFFPILRKKDPDECYEACPALFWVIIFIARRRYGKNDDILSTVAEHVAKEIWVPLSSPAMGVEGIHAALLLSSWPLPSIRFITDPSTAYTSMAMNTCLLSGFHTGRGNHSEFCFASRGHVTSTDEEASSTWLACCILTQM
jgi:transcriptional regulatory protein LEU3